MDVAALAADLRAAARRRNHRRILVLAGSREAGIDAAFDAVEGAEIPDAETTIVTGREGFRFDRVAPKHATDLLGTTRTAVICDAHESFSPNVLGRIGGTVDGGGLFVLLTPPLDAWPERAGSFEESLAVPPDGLDDVGGRFRERLVTTLRSHPGVAIVDVDNGTVERHANAGGETTEAVPERSPVSIPTDGRRRFPPAAYEACLTADQSRALRAMEALAEAAESAADAAGSKADAGGSDTGVKGNRDSRAVVIEADRGRGKSSAAGLAVGSLAAEGRDVLVTAPARRNAADVFARAAAVLDELDALDESSTKDGRRNADEDLLATSGGRVRFATPTTAVERLGAPDCVIVDEAAALPVRLLSSFLDATAVAFVTTVHGYEGAGRGFSVRFRADLAASHHTVTDVSMHEPIRYAAGDPLETWAFRTLLLDATPPVADLIESASPSTVEYRVLDPSDLAADEHLLRSVFGLLVLAHYRTEPNDLARLLDAPNLRVRALEHEGHVVSVALLAREGGLDASTRAEMYEGARVRGNMLPDVFTSQLRDEAAGRPVGYRVVRIATHHAARSQGLGSRLLGEIRAEFAGTADYLGVGYGATPELLSFWDANGFQTVHLSTTRNESSGEYSALMVDPLSPSGARLRDRHARWFRDRIPALLTDQLSDADVDVVRGALAACQPPEEPPTLTEREWRIVVGAATGPGQYTTGPAGFRRLALAALLDAPTAQDESATPLTGREERLLVGKPLQTRSWEAVADQLDYASTRECMRAFGAAYETLVDRFGSHLDVVRAERARFRD
ncbi:MAG: tRNA(Met) cytidine acetyltransferase TmcA [Halobellus sp.]|uniref:tRNA(Met) cytidine acetyltransferase TmcA n=1 Tax=Halobellus sp. TaxID=1979212 RepID=UPI0035D4C827